MSSYGATAINKKTDEKVKVLCLDDYFGRHAYGYAVNGTVYRREEFYKLYKMEREND